MAAMVNGHANGHVNADHSNHINGKGAGHCSDDKNGQANGLNSSGTHPQRMLFLTTPRSCSHLLMRMINIHEQSNFEAFPPEGKTYFFMPTMVTRRSQNTYHLPVDEIPTEKTVALDKLRAECAVQMESWLQSVEGAGNRVFLKEHVFDISRPTSLSEQLHGKGTAKRAPEFIHVEGKTKVSAENPTFFPDEFLLSFSPTFLIRHPALVIASIRRGTADALGLKNHPTPAEAAQLRLVAQYSNVRALYDFYARQVDTRGPPVILDASDIVNNPSVVVKYMDQVGLDTKKAQFKWEKYSEEKLATLDKMEKRFLDTLIGSNEIITTKTPVHVDMDQEVRKWRAEFGDALAEELEKYTRESLPDYEYLYSKRLV